jgi:hypothetical protein
MREILGDKKKADQLELEIGLEVLQAVKPLLRKPFPQANPLWYQDRARRFFRRWKKPGRSPQAGLALLLVLLDAFEAACIAETLEPDAVRMTRQILERRLQA